MLKEYSDSQLEEVSIRNHSRRQFLAGASTSALILAFLKQSAHAQCSSGTPIPPYYTPPGSPTDNPPSCSNVIEIPSPDPWLIRGCCTNTVCGYNAAGIVVTGVRHYCGQDTIPWGTSETNPNGTPFPARPDDASFCLTIYPIVSKLLSGAYDNDLEPFFKSFNPREMVSCWHELSITPKCDASGHTITAQNATDMQNYLLNFRNRLGLTTPAFGAIDTPGQKGTTNGTNYGIDRCEPFMMRGLDFYGLDLYHHDWSDPTEPLAAWDEHFGSGSNYTLKGDPSTATIAVPECNAATMSYRPDYFNETAYWLWNQKNKGARCFLTFWNYGEAYSESGRWLPNDSPTIAALKAIGDGNYSST